VPWIPLKGKVSYCILRSIFITETVVLFQNRTRLCGVGIIKLVLRLVFFLFFPFAAFIFSLVLPITRIHMCLWFVFSQLGMPRSVVFHSFHFLFCVLEVAAHWHTHPHTHTYVCSSHPPTSLVCISSPPFSSHAKSFTATHTLFHYTPPVLTSRLCYDAAYLHLCLVVASLFYDSDKTGLCVLIETYRYVCVCVCMCERALSISLSLSVWFCCGC